jgi:rSAM/selenodomain-associated transferase 1
VSGVSAGALVVLAKQPVAGQVKTRMVPPLTPHQAAEFYAALLGDVLAASAQIARSLGLTPTLAAHPPAAAAEMARGAPTEFRVTAQRGANLGERMEWAVREAASQGADRILLRGSDSPILDRAGVETALRALDDFDLAISPDLDGGYNLIGLREPVPGLFDHPMSTSTVLEDTLAKATTRGLRAHLQQATFDLDTVEDLRLLAAAREDLDNSSVASSCPRTLVYLDSEDLWP